MFPLDRLRLEHRKHYQSGVLEAFSSWFSRSGFGNMLENKFLNANLNIVTKLYFDNKVDFSNIQYICYSNKSEDSATLTFDVVLTQKNGDVRQLFDSFVSSTAHTHLLGDFRKYPNFYSGVYTSARYIVFDGAGTCLLLGSMFQSLAKTFFNLNIDLHYSCSLNRELTHVFGTWNNLFVDPDQKTWAPLSQIDNFALLGYIFQQFGVSGYQIYLSIDAKKREHIFTDMTIDYFDFYSESRKQYMYRSEQSISVVSEFFQKARQNNCSALSIYAEDFLWKSEFRNSALSRVNKIPYFLADVAKSIKVSVPRGGQFEIGFMPDRLPSEINQLSGIFLGRIPGAIWWTLNEVGFKLDLPELPWMIIFEVNIDFAKVNGVFLSPWLSECGRFRLLGMGDLEHLFDLSFANNYSLEISAKNGRCAVVLPINAFALSAGVTNINADASQFETSARVVN